MMYLVLGYIKEIDQFSRMAHLEVSQYMKENSISFGVKRERDTIPNRKHLVITSLALDMELPDAGLVFDSFVPFDSCITILYMCSCNGICEVRLVFENTWNLQVCWDNFLL